ncbi:hypothetical protein OHS18_12415 [Amycolatopsis sp. NBC_00355]|nr:MULTISPECIES: hypothetical protein [unclassified Amycolatopsis]
MKSTHGRYDEAGVPPFRVVDDLDPRASHGHRSTAVGGHRSDEAVPVLGQVEPGLERGVPGLAVHDERVRRTVVLHGVDVVTAVQDHVAPYDELPAGNLRVTVVHFDVVHAVVRGSAVAQLEGDGTSG